MRLLVRFVLGLITTFVGTVIVAGGLSNAVGIILASIICTGGIGLLFWIPVVLIAGEISYFIVKRLFKINDTPKADPAPKVSHGEQLTAPQQALVSYIRQMKERSYSRNDTIDELIRAGWSAKEIEDGLHNASKQ